MESTESRKKIVDSVARFYEQACKEKIGDNLEALYLFGSYAFGKVSEDLPDINYLLLLKEGSPPDVFLKHAELLQELIKKFRNEASILPEFRPNRYVYHTIQGADFEITICPQYARMEDRHGPVPFGWGWILEALLQTRKLVFGRDALAEIHQPPVTKDYIKMFFPPTFSHIWLPLERAPVQYKLPEESRFLMHEAHKVAQMASIGFGVTLALNEKELEKKKWLEFVTDKERLVQFYSERYDEASAKNVELMLEVRRNWLTHRNDPEMAIKMYKAAVSICTRLKAKYGELVHG